MYQKSVYTEDKQSSLSHVSRAVLQNALRVTWFVYNNPGLTICSHGERWFNAESQDVPNWKYIGTMLTEAVIYFLQDSKSTLRIRNWNLTIYSAGIFANSTLIEFETCLWIWFSGLASDWRQNKFLISYIINVYVLWTGRNVWSDIYHTTNLH